MGVAPIAADATDIPKVIAHGTQARNMASILKNGLVPGGPRGCRNENHFTAVLDTAALNRAGRPAAGSASSSNPTTEKEIPGYRTGCDTVIYFHVENMMKDNIDIFKTSSEAYLCDQRIDPKHIICARSTRSTTYEFVGKLLKDHAAQGDVLDPHIIRLIAPEYAREPQRPQPKLKAHKKVRFAGQPADDSDEEPAEDNYQGWYARHNRPVARLSARVMRPLIEAATEPIVPPDDTRPQEPPPVSIEFSSVGQPAAEPSAPSSGSAVEQASSSSVGQPAAAVNISPRTEAEKRPVEEDQETQVGPPPEDFQCHACQQTVILGMNFCPYCNVRVTEDPRAAREEDQTVYVLMGHLRIHQVWCDRGPKSEFGDFKKMCKRYLRRALWKGNERTEFNSVEDRFHNDPTYRMRMIENGWTWSSIGMVDRIATEQPGQHTGRTRLQRSKQEGWWWKFENSGAAGGSNSQAPTFTRTQERIWQSLRRAQQTARWATRDDGDNYHSRWATGDGSESHQPWETSDTTTLPLDRQWFGWWNEEHEEPSDRWATGDGWHYSSWENR